MFILPTDRPYFFPPCPYTKKLTWFRLTEDFGASNFPDGNGNFEMMEIAAA